jgi:hypothetical protein
LDIWSILYCVSAKRSYIQFPETQELLFEHPMRQNVCTIISAIRSIAAPTSESPAQMPTGAAAASTAICPHDIGRGRPGRLDFPCIVATLLAALVPWALAGLALILLF